MGLCMYKINVILLSTLYYCHHHIAYFYMTYVVGYTTGLVRVFNFVTLLFTAIVIELFHKPMLLYYFYFAFDYSERLSSNKDATHDVCIYKYINKKEWAVCIIYPYI